MVPAVRFTQKLPGELELSLHKPQRRGCHVTVLEGADWYIIAEGTPARHITSQAHPDRVPPKAPQPGTSSQAHPGRVPPKAPPPGISSLATEERLAALEEEVAKLRLRVAELEEHLSGAATG